MWETTNVFEALSREWKHAGAGAHQRAAWARWTKGAPALRELGSTAEAVTYCRGGGSGADAVLAGIARHAAMDDDAARAVLQALLPGLAALSRRGWRAGRGTWLWESVEELDQLVVSTAFALIRELPAKPTRWVAQRVIDGTWQRLRTAMAVRARWIERRHDLESARLGKRPAPEPGHSRRAGEELAAVLSDALDRQVLDPLDAWVVYRSRAAEDSLATLGAALGADRHVLGERRARAERALVAAGGPR